MGRLKVYDWAGYTLLRLAWLAMEKDDDASLGRLDKGSMDRHYTTTNSKETAGGGGTRRRNGNDTRTPEQQRPRMTDDSNTHHCLFGVVFLALRLAESHGAMGWEGGVWLGLLGWVLWECAWSG